jgi:hypothetical protein
VAGFDKFELAGAIHEVEDKEERLARITELYLEGSAQKKSSLIVAPTHAEARTIAAGVRAAMKKNGLLAKEDHVFSRLEGIDLTESQRRDPIGF